MDVVILNLKKGKPLRVQSLIFRRYGIKCFIRLYFSIERFFQLHKFLNLAQAFPNSKITYNIPIFSVT